MKKIFLTLVAALVAMAVFSCIDVGPMKDMSKKTFDQTEDGLPKPVEYTDDGLVELTLNVATRGGDRALTTALAQAGVNFYEVSFNEGANYYRTSWTKDKTGKIRVPPGTYNTPATAILFAGTLEDKTLLATGVITGIDAGGVGPITATTTSVTFTLQALTSDVNATPSSSFQITAPSTHLTSNHTIANFPRKRLNGIMYPLYLVPTGAIEATYTMPITSGHRAGVYVSATPPGSRIISSGVSSVEGDAPVTIATGIINAPSSGGPITSSVIEFDITVAAGQNGLSRLNFEVPVCAIIGGGDTVGNPITWFIRGGIENFLFDEGAAKNSTGGGILLGVGTVNDIIIGITGP